MLEAVHITNYEALLKLQVGRVSSNRHYTLRRQVEMWLYRVLAEVRR